MKIKNYGFIIKAPGYSPKVHHNVIKNNTFRSEIICVSNVDEAINVAKRMISEDIQLIELCGGFGRDAANQIIAAVNSEVPIGFVGFEPGEDRKLKSLMAVGTPSDTHS